MPDHQLLLAQVATGDEEALAGGGPSGNGTVPLVLRYNGTTWTRENVGNYIDQYTINHDIFTIAVQAPTELWAFTNVPVLSGPITNSYPMAHYRNGVWTWTSLSGNFGSINAAVFVSDSEGYAAAEKLTGTNVVQILLHYADGNWNVIPSC